MALLREEKYVGSLPGTLIANTKYYVKNGAGFDMYITNNSGTIMAYQLNTSGGGGGALWVQHSINVPFPAKYSYTVNIVAASLVNSIVEVKLADVLDTDENEKDLLDVDFKVISNNGSFDLTVFSKDCSRFGGEIKVIYKIN